MKNIENMIKVTCATIPSHFEFSEQVYRVAVFGFLFEVFLLF